MNEEELITTITKMLEKNDDIFEETGSHLFFSKSVAEDIFNLLDLYNKAKQELQQLNKSDADKESSSMEYYNAWREELNVNEQLRKELQQEKEKNKKYETIAVPLSKGNADLNGVLVFDTSKFTDKIEEQQKVIDMMAEYLCSINFDEMCGELEQPCMMHWNCREDIEMRANCIKQYYFKKARGEKLVGL